MTHRTRSSVDLAAYTERNAGGGGGGGGGGESSRAVDSSAAATREKENNRLNQIIQVGERCRGS